MIDEVKKSYAFYDYLSFLWQKRWWLVGIPLVAILIALAVSFLQKPTYEGTALFNVADATDDKVTVPDIIAANYQSLLPKDLQPSLQVIVPKYKQVQIQLSGTNSDEVSSGFQKVTKAYYADLQKVYQQKVRVTEKYIAILQQRVNTLEQVSKVIKPSSVNMQTLDAVTNLEQELSTRQEQLQLSKMDLLSLQAPVVVPPNTIDNLMITKKSSPLKANVLVALLAGLIIAIVVITIWKYTLDARSYRNEQ